MKQKIVFLVFGFLLTLGISSCVKDSAPELGSRGNTIIKFNEGPRANFFYSPFPTSTKTETITFTRDVNSNAALNKPVEVIILEDPTLVPSGYTELPAANFTYTVDPGVILTSGKITAIRFAAGEVSKKVKITLIGSAWTNVGIKYAKAYKVTDAGGNQVSAGQGTMIATFGIKNQWDGVYSVESGTVSRYTAGVKNNDALEGDLFGNPDVILATSGANSLVIPAATTGGLAWAASYGAYVAGIDGTTVTIDPATNLVTMSCTGNATLTNWAGHDNLYDPATKTFKLAFYWNPTGNKREYEIVLKYKGPRP